jgi:predicted alpha/beta-fold hydrolase
MNFRQFFALKSSFNKKKIVVLALLCPIIGSALGSAYLQLPFKNKHMIIYQENERNNYIVNQLAPLDDYRPTFYLPNCLLQMAYNELKTKININFKREFLKTEDGGMISLDWAVRPIDTEETRLIVILHGLTGGSESSYIRDIVQGLLEYENNKIVVVQYRGINDSPLLTPKSFHAGDTTDIHFALNYLRKEYGHLACYTIGTSMGANIMVKLFSHDHSFDDYIKGFVSISNPFDILTLEQRNRGNIVDYFLRRRQQSYIKRHYEVLKTLGRKIFINQTSK